MKSPTTVTICHRVSGDAQMYGNAQVYGDAQMYGNAQVYGNARVSGDAWYFSPLQIQGTMHFINFCAKGILRIGCHERTPEKWMELYEKIGQKEGYKEAEIAEYKLYIILSIEWMKIHGDGIRESKDIEK